MDSELAGIRARLERVELSNRRLKGLLLGVAVLVFGCGASTTVANYGTVRSHTIEVFGAGEKGSVIALGRDAAGGRIEIKDAQGKLAVVVDVNGVHKQ